ncbi:MAG TPA: hypothetical protein VFT10_05895 [Solirubrobacterales bacterium]|nr:hypothetical protein [Solirubrobacterales bacterium]
MIERLRDALAPRRAAPSDGGYRRLLRWAALPVTDRRWAAPLAAVALGFGLFAGVAIGPGAAGTLATAPYQVIELPTLAASDEGDEAEEEAEVEEPAEGGGEVAAGFEEEPASFAPVVPVEESTFEPVEEEPIDEGASPQNEEEPEEPEEQELAGTVVHVNPEASSYTVAEAGGLMSAVHAGKLPPVGARIEVPIRALANGTLAEAGQRTKTKSSKAAELAGIVTFVNADPLAPAYTVSNRGTSVLVHVALDPAGALPELPVLGAYVTAKVAFEGARLVQRQLSGSGAPFTHVELEGIVGAVDPEAAQLWISADDVRESGLDLTLAVPPEIDVSSLVAGDSVLASADIGPDGSLTLTGLASDERLKGAEDAKATQGDLVPEKAKGQE